MIKDHPYLHRRVYGIKVFEYLWILILYLVFSFGYHLTLWMVRNPIHRGSLFDLGVFLEQAGLNYLIFLLLTIPVWWLIFRKLQHTYLEFRLFLTVLLMPVFTIVFRLVYYEIADFYDYGRLQGRGVAWDIYIPAMFYSIQFGLFHAYEYYHANQRNLKLKAELSQAALKSELAALKAQLNPHFLYNVFNTISASVPPEQERTRELIAKLSDLFRYQLKASTVEFVPLAEELEFVNTYLSLEKARFEDRLRIEIDVPTHLMEARVPPMILQPLVENSVKHGISSLIEGGKISIKVWEKEGGIHFEIADTGIGVQDKDLLFSGVGLANTKRRIEKQFGGEMKFSDNVPHGLKIEFAI